MFTTEINIYVYRKKKHKQTLLGNEDIFFWSARDIKLYGRKHKTIASTVTTNIQANVFCFLNLIFSKGEAKEGLLPLQRRNFFQFVSTKLQKNVCCCHHLLQNQL